MRESNAKRKAEYEKRRQAAIEQANAAETAAEAQQAAEDARAAEAAKKALETQEKKKTAEINREAAEKKKASDSITRKGKQIENKLNKLSEEAQAYVRQWAEEHGIALDGTMQTGSALVKTGAHYYNQGKAGIAYNENTDDITDENREFARHINELGTKQYEEAALQAVAEEQPEAETKAAEQPVAEPQPETEEETAEQPAAEEETAVEEALQAVAEEQPETETRAEEESAVVSGEETGLTLDQAIETIRPTPEETQAAEQHAVTVEKMEDVLKGLPKKARTLVM